LGYLILKYLHVLLAITAVGSNITYAAWNARAPREPEHLGFALRGIKFIDDRIANPCYGLLLLTGLALTFVGSWHTSWPRWIVSGLVLYVVVIVIALAGYSPALRRQIDALEAEGDRSAGYLKWSRRARVTGIATIPFILAIVFLMVVKPPI
jgi:uncharacterized membrane protein